VKLTLRQGVPSWRLKLVAMIPMVDSVTSRSAASSFSHVASPVGVWGFHTTSSRGEVQRE